MTSPHGLQPLAQDGRHARRQPGAGHQHGERRRPRRGEVIGKGLRGQVKSETLNARFGKPSFGRELIEPGAKSLGKIRIMSPEFRDLPFAEEVCRVG